MTTVAERLRTHLRNDATTAALVGTRIYVQRLPQNPTYPALCMHTIGRVEDVMRGTLAYPIVTVRVQIDAHDSSYDGVMALAGAVKWALLGLRDSTVHDCRTEDQYEYWDETLGVHVVSVDALVNLTEV